MNINAMVLVRCSLPLNPSPEGASWKSERDAKKFAHFIKKLARSHRKALQIVVGQDNLNTHTPASFHQTLEPKKVLELAQCFEMQFTPKKASWLKLTLRVRKTMSPPKNCEY